MTAAVLGASVGLALGLHLGAMAVGWWSSAWLDRPRRIAVAIASSQKTLPVTLFLYERYFRARYPLAILPLLVYHVGQLLLDTAIAARLKAPPQPAEVVEAL